jgi:UDP-N-acetylglucosamine--N-acetylmuramyl-(pentapeptide) pyrophosphoryl-undecaprenol N-acetylglucosamine transferase
MTIVLTGGGSGGHITPLLVVASELKKQDPAIKLIYIGQKGDAMVDIPAKDPNIDEVYKVRAGKFRRYNGEGIKQFTDVSTMIKNIRDGFLVIIGLFESISLMRKLKPDLVFSRGGYVSVPVCLGAKFNGVRYITHDSDPVPSLTNRIIGKWATLHFVAADKSVYNYPPDKTITTGIPLSSSFKPLNKEIREGYRQKLNIGPREKMVFVIGGGLGAQSLNEAVIEIMPNMLAEFKDLKFVHVVGKINLDKVNKAYQETLDKDQLSHIEVIDFTDRVYEFSGAADVVVTRAGATNLAEFELQGVPMIVIPSTFLVAGHQLKNAEILSKSNAAIVIKDTDLVTNPFVLAKELSMLLKDPKKRQSLASGLSKFGHSDARKKIAEIILKTAEGK